MLYSRVWFAQTQVVSSNTAFTGTFFLHEFLEGNGVGRSVACIQEDGGNFRMTPGEAEERAGLGSTKNWKKSLQVIKIVLRMRLLKYLLLRGRSINILPN